MGDALPFGGGDYLAFLGVLVFARFMDFFSTWVATPTLALEANPIARWLGWRWGVPVNLGLCGYFAQYPLAATIIGTTSLLVAAHNFQGAPLMRAMGEHSYRDWSREVSAETPMGLYLACVVGQSLLTALVGGALVWASGGLIIALGIGVGILGYALMVLIFTALSIWRRRRAAH